MKRRGLLIAMATLAASGWLLRPSNQGQPHGDYFQTINDYLRRAGPGRPLMLIDRQRLAANCKTLMSMMPRHCQLRIVAKSLPSVPLIQEVMTHTGSRRIMVFHQPFMNALADAEPGCDMLLGKPMPIRAARRFYSELSHNEQSHPSPFKPDQQLQWLIEAHPEQLRFSGFMGYDAHVGRLPSFVQSAEEGHRETEALYQQYIHRLYHLNPTYRKQDLCFNGAGSPTLALYDDSTVVNELSAGSCLVKASDFDLPLLQRFQPAAFIAAPVIKQLNGLALPGPLPLGELWQSWDTNRRQSYFIYGGYWKAEPISPPGIQANPLYGASSNQMMYNASEDTALQVDDQLFLRPTQSEFVLLQFGDLAVWENGAVSDWWPPLPQANGA